ncbi:biogenesis of lysosome-related organelles complex 1 subunit 6-like [Saccostrea echinata]|uniref:biogenesis of lysosome-related organelles complex 1 subunit 6-like n=1 Tax=Saccostrea echinata TaxID=191078 RepID=UPI002A82F7A3|nr:biogenesis of lysosome-related organelles complex 1 subunit 6-like [Saccostrea echinata]
MSEAQARDGSDSTETGETENIKQESLDPKESENQATESKTENEEKQVDPEVNENLGADPEEDGMTSVDPSVVEKLSLGLLEICLPPLQKSKSSLDDLMHNQQFLVESVQQENAKFTDCQDMEEISKTMAQAKKYHMKLINLKKEMNALSEKAAKLKRRAVKIQQQKQKEDLQKVHQREREQEREKMLEAKVVKKPQSTS